MKLTKFPVIDRVQKCFFRRDETEIFDRTHRFEKSQSQINCLNILYDSVTLEKSSMNKLVTDRLGRLAFQIFDFSNG